MRAALLHLPAMSADRSSSTGCGAASLPPIDLGTSISIVCARAVTRVAAPAPRPVKWYDFSSTFSSSPDVFPVSWSPEIVAAAALAERPLASCCRACTVNGRSRCCKCDAARGRRDGGDDRRSTHPRSTGAATRTRFIALLIMRWLRCHGGVCKRTRVQ